MEADEIFKLLKDNSNLLIVAITCVVVFGLYYALPGPRDKEGNRVPRVYPPWDQVLFFAPFFIAGPLSYFFDLNVGQAVKVKLLKGLTTGTYAMVVEKAVFMFLLKNIRLNGGAAQPDKPPTGG